MAGRNESAARWERVFDLVPDLSPTAWRGRWPAGCSVWHEATMIPSRRSPCAAKRLPQLTMDRWVLIWALRGAALVRMATLSA